MNATIQATAQGLTLENNLIGRDDLGRKYYLTIEIKPVRDSALTVEHEPAQGLPVVSMSGAVLSKYGSIVHDRGWESAGQCLDSFSAVTRFANRWSADELRRVVELWRVYHLNDMQTHCAHQDKAIKWDTVEPCSVTGYRAGSAWLYSPIPDGVLIELTGLILKHRRDNLPGAAYDYEVQGYYSGHGWETLTTEETRRAAFERLAEYREHERGLSGLRVKPVKVNA